MRHPGTDHSLLIRPDNQGLQFHEIMISGPKSRFSDGIVGDISSKADILSRQGTDLSGKGEGRRPPRKTETNGPIGFHVHCNTRQQANTAIMTSIGNPIGWKCMSDLI